VEKENSMTPQRTATVIIGIAVGFFVLMAFVGAILVKHGINRFLARSSAGHGEPVMVRNAPPGRGRAVVPVLPASIPALEPPDVDLGVWTPRQHGCNLVQTGTLLHIWGVNDEDGWAAENGVAGVAEYPVEDFEVSADWKLPQFRGPGLPRVYLKARASNSDYVGIQYQPKANYYVMQRWTTNGQEFGQPTLRKIGDEATTFHKLRLQYQAATHQTTGWVDDKKIGTLTYELTGSVRFVLVAGTDVKGHELDLYFDHITVLIGGKTIVLGKSETAP
jgi:hypothetical protein